MHLPSFPITGAELRALRLAVERAKIRQAGISVPEEDAERAHQAEIHSISSAVSQRIRQSFGAAHQSSFFLMGLLLIVLALNVMSVFFIHNEGARIVMIASLVLLCLALLISIWHHFALIRHRHIINLHLLRHHSGHRLP
jgi:hypothetical protein